MKKYLIFLFAIFVSAVINETHCQSTLSGIPFSFEQETSISDKPADEEIIKWSEKRKLTWADFKGKPQAKYPYDAASNVEIDWSAKWVNGKVEFNIYAGFTTRSFTKTTSLAVLEHEQLHFDLGEVYARMIRKYAAETSSKIPYSDECVEMMNHYFQSLRSTMKSEQFRYDVETKHGIIKTKQAEWKSYIERKLLELNGYK